MTGNKKIGEILIELGFITQEQLNAALSQQKEGDSKKKIGEILVELGFLNEIDLLKCLAGLFKVRYISSDKLLKMTIPQWVLELIPSDFAVKNNVFPFFCYDKSKIVSVAIADPENKQLPKLIKNVSGYNEVELYIALDSTIKAGIEKFYRNDSSSLDNLKSVIKTESPQSIASFLPKDDSAALQFDSDFTESDKPVLKPTQVLKRKSKTVIIDDQILTPTKKEEESQKRLADQISPLSVTSEDTFIEVLNIVINVLEMYKGESYRGHSASVAKLVKEISQNLGLKAKETYYNVLAAYLHDCCMVAPEHLTLFNFNSEHNRDLLKKYSRSSERLYDGARLPPEVHKILLHTLERYDGEGYPDGLKGDDIPLGSRIIATIDALLHLLNFEGYENFKSSFDIILSLKEKYFDPEIVDIVEEIILDLFIDELSPRAIIIDTNPEELEHLSVLLKKNGIFPYPLKDTEKVIAILDSSPVCLIVSEVNTKPLDGFSICDLVKTNDKYRNINFVFLSEKNDSATVSKGFDAGADDFITKPYNPSILIAKIQNFIKHSLRKTEEKAKTASTKKGITGNLAEIHVTDLIQMLFAGGKTGALKLFKEDENGEVFFNQGQVINARYKHVEGVEAFNLLVRWGHGLFILDPDAQLLDQIIFYSTEMLLIEACRVWDEEKQGAL